MNPEGLGYARPKLFRLDQEGYETAQVVRIRPPDQVFQSLLSRFTSPYLQVDQPQFVRKLGVGPFYFFGHFVDRRVQPYAGLDADNHQVEGVGDPMLNLLFSFGDPQPDPEVGQIKPHENRQEQYVRE